MTGNQYLNEGNPKRSIYHILKTRRKRNSCLTKRGSKGRNKTLSKVSLAAVVQNNTNKRGVSPTQQSKRYHFSASTKIEAKMLQENHRADQFKQTKLNCKKLLRTFSTWRWIFFKLKSDTTPGKDRYFSKGNYTVSRDLKFRAIKTSKCSFPMGMC